MYRLPSNDSPPRETDPGFESLASSYLWWHLKLSQFVSCRVMFFWRGYTQTNKLTWSCKTILSVEGTIAWGEIFYPRRATFMHWFVSIFSWSIVRTCPSETKTCFLFIFFCRWAWLKEYNATHDLDQVFLQVAHQAAFYLELNNKGSTRFCLLLIFPQWGDWWIISDLHSLQIIRMIRYLIGDNDDWYCIINNKVFVSNAYSFIYIVRSLHTSR